MRQRTSHYKRLSLFLFFALTHALLAVAQDSRVTGTVKDSVTDLPISGASILVRTGGKSTGSFTDRNGEFSIQARSGAILLISSVGYEELRLNVAGDRVDVKLSPRSGQLNDVVVVGYGSSTKKDVTGAVKSVKSSEFNRGIINSPEQLLQGKVAGVNVTSASGEPGAIQNITVRGPGGVRTGSTPLFVVDGFALDNSSTGGATNPLAFLNPQDIQSIDVLKDASATSIYGSRGANGVIIITTKKGKAGFSTLNYSVNLGVSKLARALPLFSAEEYRTQVVALGGVVDEKGADTDWQKEITRNAFTQTHNLSFSGGANQLSYYASLAMQKQEGIIKGNQFDNYSARMNASQKLLEGKLTVDVNLTATNIVNERPPSQAMIGSAISANPTYPAYAADGSPARYQAVTNPLLTLELEREFTKINRVLGTVAANLSLAKGLVYRLNFGIDNSTSTSDYQSKPNQEPFQPGGLSTVTNLNRNRLIENYLTWSFKQGDHSLTALLGHSYQNIFVQGRSNSITRFPIASIDPRYNPGLGQELTLANNRPGGFAVINELQSFFSRVNYQYKNKYLLTGTVRADGSSKFGENNKYGVFPSFSAGWIISQEGFMAGSIFNSLKLRAGWGQTGNQEIPSKITQALFTSQVSGTTSYPLYPTGTYPGGTSYSRLANPDIQWEVSSQTDIGVDFGFFGGALTGTLDYFRKVTNNILLEVIPADPVQPAGSFWTNVEDMNITNKGLELDLNYQGTNRKGLTYNFGGNLTLIDNMVSNSPYSVIQSGAASGSGLTSATINGYVNGQPIGTFFLREFTGLDRTGMSTYRDVDGDGLTNDRDRLPLGSALPTLQYNFNGGFSFRSIDFAASFNGVSGNKVYDNTANSNFYKLRLSKGINTTPEAIADANESVNNAAPVSSRYLKNGAFFRLNNASLGYNFKPETLGLGRWVSNLRLFVTGQNLFVITDYNGFDPEVNTDRTVNGISSYGIDYLSYPKATSIILGLNIALK
ncbi:SusC/RagA family TonB-linked outer membrane protein [Segetibacter sp. 3557_3]|uniref:SusC/RagA family TonB-linked outer membrane protein n=1 Tax=Segetibacter sp. 3557_3 TaxID=2547429 RepID=UPI00105859CA|nr:SusC/RagA family TonB-linked outer membrane protein [Segetibacter sp. 3557_3]TDH24625.1 SusC/RagA family TonB-linked outer membrane protein [Segetibacter sp. 3557_3]